MTTDPHERFAGWLAAGAADDPPRDLALHASACNECLSRAAAVDALSSVDPGVAPEPPLHVGVAPRRTGLVPVARAAAGFATLGLLGAAMIVAANALLVDRSQGGTAGESDASPVEGVLGAAFEPTQTPEAASASPSPSDEPSDEASPEPTPSPQTSRAPTQIGPAPPAVTIPAGTPRPTPAPPTSGPTRAPSTMPTPSPDPAPTSTPTPVPTPTPPPTPPPTPTPEPTPSEPSASSAASCTNGVDDDGDLLVDQLDPGCVLGSKESDL